jgi:hypothetical protein
MEEHISSTRLSFLVTPDTHRFFEWWIAPLLRESLGLEITVSSISHPRLSDITNFNFVTMSCEMIPDLLEHKLLPDLSDFAREFSDHNLDSILFEDKIVGIRFAPFRSDTVLTYLDTTDEIDPAQNVAYLVKIGVLILELACKANPPPLGKECPEAIKVLTEPSCNAEMLLPGTPCPPKNIVPPMFPNLKCFSVLEDHPNCGYSSGYNCLGWALETKTDVWPKASFCVSSSDMKTFLENNGYKLSYTCNPTFRKRKIAVFGITMKAGQCHKDLNMPKGASWTIATHVAREIHDGGWWTSKLGKLWCIVHRLKEIESAGYGKVLFCMEKDDPSANLNLDPSKKIPRTFPVGGVKKTSMECLPGSDESFERAFQRWLRDVQKPQIQIQSRIDAYTDLDSYRAMIDFGPSALPFIIDILREGISAQSCMQGFFAMNEAIAKITGINLRNKHPEDIGEQRLAELWIKWWEERRS